MMIFHLLFAVVVLTTAQKNGFCNLQWSDEFNGGTLSSDWTKESTCYGGGNNELECYTARDKNVFLQDGSLVLRAYRETYTGSQSGCTDSQGCTWTKDYTSGRVNTAGSRSFLHGRFEVRAKLTKGTHLWPAIWMLPTDWTYGGWAASGEIDIMEQRGDTPNIMSGTLHHGGAWPNNVWTTSGDHGLGSDLSADFHVYALEWTSTQMKWFIDDYNFQTFDLQRWWNVTDNRVYSARGQPFDQRFHFVLNLAVGGGFFGGYPALTDSMSAQWAVPEMRVDYVRVWSQGGSCSATPTPTTTTTSTSTSTSRAPSTSSLSPAVVPTGGSSAGNALCNGQAYDSQTYTCTINQLGNQVLCPTGTSSCGTACFSPSLYCCSGGSLVAKSLCSTANQTPQAPQTPPSTQTSRTTTANPITSSSVATSASPSTGICNGQSYATNAYTCATNEQGNHVLCPVQHSACGSACYLASLYCCKNGALRQTGTC